ncbi:mRNA export factor GLE1 isoform X1 [Ranitomeya variabilis]|uniref:mRNA export factor GLE1 isoform X1 n=2 Tax=Ranitomeya variabilis TaxID=490064 RepID=UPI004057B977
MPSKPDLATLEALRNSPKGRLQYNRGRSSESTLGINESTVVLSEYAVWVLDNITNHSEPDDSRERPSPRHDVLSSTRKESEKMHSEESLTKVASSSKQRMEKAMEVEGSIILFEKAQELKVKEEMQSRIDMWELFSKSLAEKSVEQLKRFQEMMELKLRQEKNQLLEELKKGSKEALGQQEKLKEEHRHRAKLLTLKLREAEQQRQQEMERIRQEEGHVRMQRLWFLQQEVLQLVQKIQVDYKQQEALRVDLSAYGHRGNQICGILSSVVRSSSERGFPTQEDVSVGEQSLQEMQMLASTIEKELAAAEERKKAEEEVAKEKQKQAELLWQQQQAAPQTPAPAQTHRQTNQEGLQRKASQGTMQRFQELQKVLEKYQKVCEDFATSGDPQTKKLRTELQRVVSVIVSQISSVSGSIAKDSFDKINNILMGKPHVFARRTIHPSGHPRSLDFVYIKLAEKLVEQGEEEVASNHSTAFLIASVTLGLCERYPKLGELFLANLHKKCPYTVPYYPACKEGTPLEEYGSLMGYQVRDSKLELQGSFLKRMSGMIRLYAAIIQVRWPFGTNQGSHLFGLNQGWHWLAQMVNMEPLPDITATVLYIFLEACGNAMMKQYQDQFWKLLYLIKDQYVPRIEKITDDAEKASVARLKAFLEGVIRQRDIPLPTGYLQPSFWRT